MAIILAVLGVVILAASDWIQPKKYRKTKLNFYMGSLGGIVWLAGIILAFVNYSFLHSVLLILGCFFLAAILGVRGN